MINWLKKILGFSKPEPVAPVVESTPEPTAKKVTKPKTTKKKSTSTKKKGDGKGCDFDKLTKTQLLKEAKHRGIPANASLKKSELVARLKNG